jgi:hypothetical protein
LDDEEFGGGGGHRGRSITEAWGDTNRVALSRCAGFI